LGNPESAPTNYKSTLLTIENFARLNEWIEQGEVNIQVWLEGNRAIRGIIKADKLSVPVAVTSRPRSVFDYVLDATIRDEPDQGHQNVDRI
jgi:hypothetical protein